MEKQKIGINSSFCNDSMDKKALDNIKASGFDQVMLSKFESAKELERYIQHAFKIGLKVPFVHLPYGDKNEDKFWSDGKDVKKNLKSIAEYIKVCSKFNISTVVMHVAFKNSQSPNKAGIERMNLLLKTAENENVKIAIENTGWMFDDHIAYLLDNIKSSWLGLCYDCGHYYKWPPKEELIKKYSDRIFAIHIHDNLLTKGGDFHLLPFDGKINFQEVAMGLAKSIYSGVIMLETHMDGDEKRNEKYAHMSIGEYLKQAKRRANKFSKMLSACESNIKNQKIG